MGTEILRPQDCLPRRKTYRRSVIRPKRSEPLITKLDEPTKNVTILKRGESIDNLVVRVRTTEEIYAGSAFFSSPSPRKLPLPSFSKKTSTFVVDDELATKDLRRLLRLDS
ncbi:hypothetical protein IFM89_000919 [Coptis chinensis]|uniref:Uncharacterized protein n=1 Tax=Coptis chinensis TaxID=261450 RepID=A0A835IJF1_9MAGN|nr:hypothetical protein IFM89_000919 [Coptis chinensis]